MHGLYHHAPKENADSSRVWRFVGWLTTCKVEFEHVYVDILSLSVI
jgi:hypothetical protein